MMSARWLPVVAFAVAIHAALLFSLRIPIGGGSAESVVRSVTVRFVTPQVAVSKSVVSAASPMEPEVASDPEELKSSLSVIKAPSQLPLASASGTGRAARIAAEPAPAASMPVARSQAEPGLPPAPAYLSGGQLDPGPRPLQDVEPAFPDEAGLQHGIVVLRLLINEFGVVDQAAVVHSAPKGLFEKSAIEAFAAARFSPGMLLGLPVKSQVTIEVEFAPFNRGANVTDRTY
jgi:TonB family protein